MKKYATQYEKRKLLYEKRLKDEEKSNKNVLDLPIEYRNKISQAEHKKIKEAFYIQSNAHTQTQPYTLDREQFVNVLRALSIVAKTVQLYEQFDSFKCERMNWEQFLRVYLTFRTQKGSYNQLNNALNQLGKQYRGDWNYLQQDLLTIGDVLSNKQLQIFYKEIIGNKPISQQLLLNTLLGYK